MIGGNSGEHANREALRERLSAYLDGELAPDDTSALERHLAACPECRDELAALREVRALLRALPPPVLPRSFALPSAGTTISPEEFQPARAAARPLPGRAPHAGPVRARSRPTLAPVPALARAAQWVGGLAAAVGLLLIVATAVLGGNLNHTYSAAAGTSAGGERPAPLQHTTASPQQTASPRPQKTPTRPSVAQGAESPTAQPVGSSAPGTSVSPPAPTATNGPASTGAPSEATPFPVLPVAGGGLLAGGVVLFASGSVAKRRRSQRSRRDR